MRMRLVFGAALAAALASVPATGGAPPPPTFTQIAVGTAHTCAITNAGRLMCWGDNRFGQLGTGSRIDRWVPVEVAGLGRGIKAVATGAGHTCALTAAGRVRCWGNNAAGQLGNGTRTSSNVPVDVAGLGGGIRAIAAGSRHSCAVTSGGTVKCWGFVGLDSPAFSPNLRPVDAAALGGEVKTTVARVADTCALTSAGGLTCVSPLPVAAGAPASGVRAVAIGDTTTSLELAGSPSHYCVLTSAGGVKCWGGNAAGQLGNGSTVSSDTPVDVQGLTSGVVSLAARDHLSCAVARGGKAVCWGMNRYWGQLGNGSNAASSSVPVPVSGLGSGVAAVAAGGKHACALLTSGRARCWGQNLQGQLGNGTRDQPRTPVDVVFSPRERTAQPARPRQSRGVVRERYFKSPSGNISCGLGDSSAAYCRTWEPPQSVRMGYDGKVSICTGSRRCTGPCVPGNRRVDCSPDTTVVLAYGRRSEFAQVRCDSAFTGVTCRLLSGPARGKGFRINREGVTRVG